MSQRRMLLALGVMVALLLILGVWGWSQYGGRRRAEGSSADLQAQLQEEVEALKQVTAEKEDLAASNAEDQRHVSGLEGRVAELASAVDLAEASKKSLAADLEAERSKNRGPGSAQQTELASVAIEPPKAPGQPDATPSVSDDAKKAKDAEDAAKSSAQQAQQSLKTAQDQVKAKEALIAKLQQVLSTAQEQAKAKDGENTKLTKDNANLEKQIRTLQSEVARLKKQLAAKH
jgi:predicted nuclease with TOPRIM domain